MGEFKKRARLDMKAEGHIPGPLQQKFTPQRWEKAFKECGDPDDEDLNIYEAALAIHEKLSASSTPLARNGVLSGCTPIPVPDGCCWTGDQWSTRDSTN